MNTENEIIEQPAAAPDAAAPAEPSPSMADAISASLKDDGQEGQPAEQISAQDTQGATRDAQGRFLKKDGEADPRPATGVDDKPALPAEAKSDAKPEDMPEGLTPKAQERFREMSERTKTLAEENATYKDTLTNLTTALQEHGVTDEVFRDLLAYSKVVTSGDVGKWEQMLANQIANYERATGKSFGGVDTLSAHQDLKQAVDSGQLTKEYAMQLVQSRDVQARLHNESAQAHQAHQSQQAQEQEMNKGVSAVASLCQGYQSNDLDWPVKKAMVEKYANDIAASTPPSLWASSIQAFYKNLQMPVAAPQAPQHRPLRSQGGAMGTREPQNMQDAIRASMA